MIGALLIGAVIGIALSIGASAAAAAVSRRRALPPATPRAIERAARRNRADLRSVPLAPDAGRRLAVVQRASGAPDPLVSFDSFDEESTRP